MSKPIISGNCQAVAKVRTTMVACFMAKCCYNPVVFDQSSTECFVAGITQAVTVTLLMRKDTMSVFGKTVLHRMVYRSASTYDVRKPNPYSLQLYFTRLTT